MWGFFLLILSASATCPHFSCNETESIECIQVQDGQIVYHPCPADFICPVISYEEIEGNVICEEAGQEVRLGEVWMYEEEGHTCGKDQPCSQSLYRDSNVGTENISGKSKRLGQKCSHPSECGRNTVCNQGHCIALFSLETGTLADSKVACQSARLQNGVCLDDSSTVGNLPKMCETDADCTSSAGEPAKCVCGQNEEGQAYCALHDSDEPVIDYLAASHNGDKREAYRLLLKAVNYPFLKGAEGCWKGVVNQISDNASGKMRKSSVLPKATSRKDAVSPVPILNSTCQLGYTPVDGLCSQLVWSASAATLVKVGNLTQPSTVFPTHHGDWKGIQEVPWIWRSRNNDIGTFSFSQTFGISQWVASRLGRVVVTASADDYYTIKVNGYAVDVLTTTVWNHPPQTFDLTPYIVVANTTGVSVNLLEINATNSGGPGGLTFQVAISVCERYEIGNGVCNPECNSSAFNFDGGDCVVCEVDFLNIAGVCIQTVWNSSSATLVVVGNTTQPSVAFPAHHSAWRGIPGVSWIWVSPNNTVGTFLFRQTFNVSRIVKNWLGKATILASVDDYFTIKINGNVVANVTKSIWTNPPGTYDLTQYVLVGNNVLEIQATNQGGFGGLTFQVVLSTCRPIDITDGGCDSACNTPAFNYDGGDCVPCAADYINIKGVCIQSTWNSSAATLVTVGNITQYSVPIAPQSPNWHGIPGVQWIWVSPNNNVGTFVFTQRFLIPKTLMDLVSQVKLTASVDDYFIIKINGIVIVNIRSSVWNHTAGTYDLTPYILAAGVTNVLEIHATNLNGTGGLTFQIALTLCKPSSIGNGVCDPACNTGAFDFDGGDCLVCVSGFYKSGGVCTQLVWYSDATTLVSDNGVTKPSVVIDSYKTWYNIASASFIWLGSTNITGTYEFIKTFSIPVAMQSKVSYVVVHTVVDNCTDIYINDYLIATKAGTFSNILVSDLTPYIRYSSVEAPVFNKLVFNATNTVGPGGLSFRIIISSHS